MPSALSPHGLSTQALLARSTLVSQGAEAASRPHGDPPSSVLIPVSESLFGRTTSTVGDFRLFQLELFRDQRLLEASVLQEVSSYDPRPHFESLSDWCRGTRSGKMC
jgi:hypothetical protein